MIRFQLRQPVVAAVIASGLALLPAPVARGEVTGFDGLTPGTSAYGITPGPDGALWFTNPAARRIGRITTAGVVTEFDGLDAASRPYDIVAGPDGALWFTDPERDRIGRITVSGEVTQFDGLAAGARPTGITAGPDGALWFAEPGIDRIGRITTDGVVTEFGGLVPGSQPLDVTRGPDGAIWFSEAGAARLGRITTSGFVTEISSLAGPTFAVASHGQTIWASEPAHLLERNNAKLVEHPVPLSVGGLERSALASGTNGQMWFNARTPEGGPALARVNSSGTTFVICSSPGGDIRDIAVGADNAVWFTASNGSIVRATHDTASGSDCGIEPPPPPPPPAPVRPPPPPPPDQPVPGVLAEAEATPAERPQPDLGESVVVEPVSGTVTVQLPGAAAPVPLGEVREIPSGTIVDADNGRLLLESARNSTGTVQSAHFRGARFRVRYARAARRRGPMLTELTLRESLADCRARRRGARQSARRPRRALWGRGSGRFRTRGRFASATVRGTTWITSETCAGTRVRVVEGRVEVTDRATGGRRVLRSGQRLLVRAPRRR